MPICIECGSADIKVFKDDSGICYRCGKTYYSVKGLPDVLSEREKEEMKRKKVNKERMENEERTKELQRMREERIGKIEKTIGTQSAENIDDKFARLNREIGEIQMKLIWLRDSRRYLVNGIYAIIIGCIVMGLGALTMNIVITIIGGIADFLGGVLILYGIYRGMSLGDG